MKRLMASVALLALTATGAYADDNEIHVFQLGFGNSATNVQDGTNQSIGTETSPFAQIGIENVADFTQTGFPGLGGGGQDHILTDGVEVSGQIGAFNVATIDQFGHRHVINRVLQFGAGNEMTILQENEDQTLTNLEQRGLGNTMTITQHDSDQTGTAEQFGFGNTMEVVQEGGFNSFDIQQGVWDEGLPNFGGSVTALQSGFGNDLEVRQAGGPGHVVVSNQIGFGLSATMHQGYTPAP